MSYLNSKREQLLSRWLRSQKEVMGAYLIGTCVHGLLESYETIDVLLVIKNKQKFFHHLKDIKSIDERTFLYRPLENVILRLHLRDITWTCLKPLKDEALRAICNGSRILYDPDGHMSALWYCAHKVIGPMSPINNQRMKISHELIESLIKVQFPEWKNEAVKAVPISGWCNGSFRLGQDKIARFPRATRYAKAIEKEFLCLNYLNGKLPFKIPKPLVIGRRTEFYPWDWSVYQWIEGDCASNIPDANKEEFVLDLAYFLNSLHEIESVLGPKAWDQPFFRGGHLRVYDQETRESLSQLKGIVDIDKILSIWSLALETKWEKPAVWVHGDLFPQNMLIKNGKLEAILDFGSCAVGDPACDLALAWTFFNEEERESFKNALAYIDEATWLRGKAWAIWKAALTLAGMEGRNSSEAKLRIQILETIVKN